MSKARQHPPQRGPAARKRPVPKGRAGTPPWLPAIITLVGVAVAVIAFIATRPGPPPPPPKHANYVADLGRIGPAELDRVGKGSANTNGFKPVSEAALTSGGHPEVLFMGAEYCPYCAGERWALIVALSRFGSFTNVQPITSSEGNIPTFTFHGSSYASTYLTFVSVEESDRNGNKLDNATDAQLALDHKYAADTIPFVDFGNRFAFNGATYDVSTLQGLTWQQIVDQLKQPGSGPAQGILGSANLITAGICELTDQQPGNVCASPVIQQLEKQLPK